LCTNPEAVTLGTDGFRKENFGTGEHCYEVRGYDPTETKSRLVCWNFASDRTLKVNGMTAPCLQGAAYALTAKRADGFCVQIGMGNGADAGFLFPIR
jgi:hypothetical protein